MFQVSDSFANINNRITTHTTSENLEKLILLRLSTSYKTLG